jgi:hypothetical protein
VLNFVITSVDQVMLLEKRNKRYFKSVALGIQSGIILIKVEFFKEILIPFVKETGGICYIFFKQLKLDQQRTQENKLENKIFGE